MSKIDNIFRDVKLLVRIKISNNCLKRGHVRNFCCFTIQLLAS